MRKKEILGALGSGELLRRQQLQEALTANDRAKYYLAVVGFAQAQALNPAARPETLKAERENAGIGENAFDSVIPRAATAGRDLVAPHLKEVLANLTSEVQTMIDVIAHCGASEAESLAGRFEKIASQCALSQDRLSVSLIPKLLGADRAQGDSLHLVIMDAHKVLNRLLGTFSEETLAGASVFGITPQDREYVRAFMEGVNRTSHLRFDHPGLDTTATRIAQKLIIQNDIGETDAHVFLLAVAPGAVQLTYTDVHEKRAQFFTDLLRDLGPSWEAKVLRRTSELPESSEYYLLRGHLPRRTEEELKRILRSIGSRLVFLIDWNKARKRLRIFVKGKDAVEVLRWAAENEIGHRAFLKLGGPDLIYDALELAGPGVLRPGEPLYQVLGKDAAKDFLREVLRITSVGLTKGESELLIRDRIKAALLTSYRTRARGPLAGCHEVVSFVVESALTLRHMLRALWRGDRAFVDRCRSRIASWEEESDDALNRARKAAAARHIPPEALVPACHLDDAEDTIEEASYLLSLAGPETLPAWIWQRFEEGVDLVVRLSQEAYKAVASAEEAFSETGGLEDFTRSVNRLDELSHRARTLKRDIQRDLVQEVTLPAPQVFLTAEVLAQLTRAADSLAQAGFALHRSVFEKPQREVFP